MSDSDIHIASLYLTTMTLSFTTIGVAAYFAVQFHSALGAVGTVMVAVGILLLWMSLFHDTALRGVR